MGVSGLMAYQVTRTIRKPNGRTYTYTFWQESVRVPGRKTPKTVYLGRGEKPRRWWQPIPDEERGLKYIERQMEKYPELPEGLQVSERTAKAATLFKERTELNLQTKSADPVVPIEKSQPEAPQKEAEPAESDPAAAEGSGIDGAPA